MATLKPNKQTDRFLHVFFDTGSTQDLEKHYRSFEHLPKFISAQQMFSKCEEVDYLSADCKQYGERTHVFWAQRPLGKLIDYLRQSRLFADKIYVISHKSRGYDAQLLLRKFLELR